MRRVAAVVLVVGLAVAGWYAWRSPPAPPPAKGDRARSRLPDPPLQLSSGPRFSLWWDAVPADVEAKLTRDTVSNIHPADYAGPDACQRCHPTNHAAWSQHPHRWMNALATDAAVVGDFSGVTLDYRSGTATFGREGTQYRMRLQRGPVRRTYVINQTLGRRFYQYYVGKLVDGPEPREHHFYHRDHVLPFGYWIAAKEWVPVVHVGPEKPDDERPDPFAPPDHGPHYADYAASCNYCHTTFPLGDLLARRPHQLGRHAPRTLHWSLRGYLDEAHPGTTDGLVDLLSRKNQENPLVRWEAPKYAVTLGVSCEACHLGSKAHVDSGGIVKPGFFPASPHLGIEGGRADTGRTHANVNWACGRCHVGSRPEFAGGMSTWNSVEYSDAMRGSCYSKLRCVDCHDPHKPLGATWARTREQDDAVCLKCHERFRSAEGRRAHTHHTADGAGCLDCHMPRINEGVQDVVRTHMIISPTRADMLEANHPNACNLCHTDKPIDWTLEYLGKWYGKKYDAAKVAAAYPRGAVAVGWAKSGDPAVRLVGVEAICRARDKGGVEAVMAGLDDAYLINRQFAAKGLEAWLGVRLRDVGYRFLDGAEGRKKGVEGVRRRWAEGANR